VTTDEQNISQMGNFNDLNEGLGTERAWKRGPDRIERVEGEREHAAAAAAAGGTRKPKTKQSRAEQKQSDRLLAG